MTPNRPRILVPFALVLGAGCASTRDLPPEEATSEIVAALAAGRGERADRLYGDAASDEERRQRLYPLLYQAARERFEAGEAALAADVLDFLARRHPEGTAVREALLYALFLERAQQRDEPEPDLLEELARTSGELRAGVAQVPPFVDLVEAQLAIDRNDLAAARARFDRFRSRWDGEPAALALYVDDVERYLLSH